MTEAQDSLVGQTIQGRYRVLRLIGRGGMGSVYEVEHLAFGGRFALKTLRAELTRDTGAIRRFKLEARAAAATGHKHIVQVTDMGESEDGTPFIVLELLKGRSLAKEIQSLGRLSPARSVSIALQCCAALAATHERGIVHRDLKPENIFLLSDHAPADFVKVLDFGVSKFTEGHAELGISRRTTEGTQIGTPVFMSPEQLAGAADVGPAADQFSLGVVLYEMLTGRLPFEERSFAALVVAITTLPVRPPSEREHDVPPELDAVVLRTLEKKPGDRFASMAELALALLPLHRPTHADTSGGWTAALAGPIVTVEGGPASEPVTITGDERANDRDDADEAAPTTLPRRKPIQAPAGARGARASAGRRELRESDRTGPIGSRDSGADEGRPGRGEGTRVDGSASSSRTFRIVLVAAAAAVAIALAAVVAIPRVVGGGGSVAPAPGATHGSSSARDARESAPPEDRDTTTTPATPAAVATTPTVPRGEAATSDAGSAPGIASATQAGARDAADPTAARVPPRTEARRGARDPDRSRAAPERTTPARSPSTTSQSASRSVTIRSEWDATVSVRFACGERTVRASVSPFASRTVTLPATDCMVHCTSAAGLPRCPLRLSASASSLAVRR